MSQVLALINSSRAQNGAQPVTLNDTQSACVLPYAIHLSEIGTLTHEGFGLTRPCPPYQPPAGENLGYGGGGNAHQTIIDVHTLMMNETHTPQFCAVSNDHACNIINPTFRTVGIAVYTDAGGNTYIVEDFTG